LLSSKLMVKDVTTPLLVRKACLFTFPTPLSPTPSFIFHFFSLCIYICVCILTPHPQPSTQPKPSKASQPRSCRTKRTSPSPLRRTRLLVPWERMVALLLFLVRVSFFRLRYFAVFDRPLGLRSCG